MFKTTRRLFLSLVLVSTLAGSALATSESQLLVSANALLGSALDVEAQVLACSEGDCPDAAQILVDLAVVESQLAALQAARDSLTTCGCTGLDAVLGDIDASVAASRRVTWGTIEDQD